jgi:hypothetical protein
VVSNANKVNLKLKGNLSWKSAGQIHRRHHVIPCAATVPVPPQTDIFRALSGAGCVVLSVSYVITLPRMTAPGAACLRRALPFKGSSSIMMHQINERADYSAEFWSLIHLESELMVAGLI